MAKVIGPLHSFEARGKIASMVFGLWRGIQWVRMHFIPENPKTVKQINIRTALTLMVAAWQAESAANKLEWDEIAKGKPLSGYNMYMSAGLDEYIIQITIDVTPVSVAWTAPYPGTWAWL